MAAEPGEIPSFDIEFGPEKTYEAEIIADRVVWPLVDGLWHGNWRTDSIAKQEFTFPRTGEYQGSMLDIELNADCEFSEGMLSRSAVIVVEEILTGDLREFTLAAAKQQFDEETEEWDEDEEEADEWPEGDESTFIVRRGVAYTFEDSGDWHINLYHAIEGPEERLTVYPSDAEGSIEDLREMSVLSQRIREHDLEMMDVAARLLGASPDILFSLEDIKANPQTT